MMCGRHPRVFPPGTSLAPNLTFIPFLPPDLKRAERASTTCVPAGAHAVALRCAAGVGTVRCLSR